MASLPTRTGDSGSKRPFFQQDLWHYTVGKMVDACLAYGLKPFYGPFGDFSDPAACEAQFRNAFLQGCLGAWSLHPTQIDIAKRVFSPDEKEVAFAKRIIEAMPDGTGRGDDRRQDAGRRHLEAGQGDRRPRPAGGRKGPRAGGGLRALVRRLPRVHLPLPASPP